MYSKSEPHVLFNIDHFWWEIKEKRVLSSFQCCMESNGAIIYLTSKASFVVSFIEPKFLEILQFCGYGLLVNFYVFAFLYYAFFVCVCVRVRISNLTWLQIKLQASVKDWPIKKTLRPGSSVLAAFTFLRECYNCCLCFWCFFFL